METNYPNNVAFSYSVTPLPAPEPSTEPEEEIGADYPKSSKLLICHDEVLNMFCITSKATVYMWRKNRGFPPPVTRMPLRWLRSAVEEWKVKVGYS